LLEGTVDYLVWYARNRDKVKYRQIFFEKSPQGDSHWDRVEMPDGTRRKLAPAEIADHSLIPKGAELYRLTGLHPAGINETGLFDFAFNGKSYKPPRGRSWKTTREGMERLARAKRLEPYEDGESLNYVLKFADYPVTPIGNLWGDLGAPTGMIYAVQTNPTVVQRCMLMTTDPGDLVLDPTCGSGTTAFVGEQWGRRWITCDTSRVALTLSKQRLMTSAFEYYVLKNPAEGVDGGLSYEEVPHLTLGSITQDDPSIGEVLYDRPYVDRNKVRVTGPFTVEAVPAPMVKELTKSFTVADATVGRSGATLREADWRSDLLKSGVRGLGGKFIKFSRVEPVAATTFIHAEAETSEEHPRRVAISFGPDYAPLEQRQVQGAWKEAQMLNPSPSLLLFAAFQFDPEAAKDIDEMDPRLTSMAFLKVQMNMDLLTGDLKKKRAANEGFWLIGRPDVEVRQETSGRDKGKYVVEIHGFDYYDVKTGNIESGNADRIAMWMLDTDYDERSLFPRQVFFPMAGERDGWSKVAKSLRAEIDEDLIDAYRGTFSLPFEPGKNRRVAVKIVDDRGVESLRVVKIP